MLKKISKYRNNLDPDPDFFQVWIQDPDPHPNLMDPEHCLALEQNVGKFGQWFSLVLYSTAGGGLHNFFGILTKYVLLNLKIYFY